MLQESGAFEGARLPSPRAELFAASTNNRKSKGQRLLHWQTHSVRARKEHKTTLKRASRWRRGTRQRSGYLEAYKKLIGLSQIREQLTRLFLNLQDCDIAVFFIVTFYFCEGFCGSAYSYFERCKLACFEQPNKLAKVKNIATVLQVVRNL